MEVVCYSLVYHNSAFGNMFAEIPKHWRLFD